ncbi:ATP-binding protein [Mesosutterella sp. AGMB02718]|uniref:histidine kinase n=1 Tax=Mesosutterella faecium TaxID=2925194 RepID=A0ABT7IQJ9_9BURK|nr:ATP-binding protein [Mesosutterella sp. AGMB02718]MDL2060166.1 ATP-binding protein [Mesosutterella sp. AGMB02718]
MSSIIAHELRQPLATISMYCYGLIRRIEDGRADRGTVVTSLQKISEQNERASDIVRQVRSYAKGNRERSPQDLAALARAAASDMAKTLQGSKTRLTLRIPPGPVPVLTSPLEIRIIVTNLLRNAAQALKDAPQGDIVLALRREGGEALLEVSDNGPRIDDARWQAMTEERPATTKASGLGLGLSIVRSIARDHGGRVELERLDPRGLLVRVAFRLLEQGEKS